MASDSITGAPWIAGWLAWRFDRSRYRQPMASTIDGDPGIEAARMRVEAVLERLDVKQQLFARLEKVIGAETIVSSNTSGLPIAQLMEGRSAQFKKNFLVTHFFNPPRYMKLLELVAGPETDPAVFDRVRRFGEDVLGKGIVIGKDTPNFVGNRIGAYAMMTAIHQMLTDGLTPEDVDAIAGEPMARPRSSPPSATADVSASTFVHVAEMLRRADPGRGRETFKVPDYNPPDGRSQDPRRQDQGRLLQRAPRDRDPRPQDRRYRAKQHDPAIASAVKSLKSIEDSRAV